MQSIHSQINVFQLAARSRHAFADDTACSDAKLAKMRLVRAADTADDEIFRASAAAAGR